LFSLSGEVEDALARRKPIIALESTVIAHGLPSPQNLETARRLEEIVRVAGAVPATIAILDGKLCVGLSDEQIRFIAQGDDLKKVSIRDLPVAIAARWNGATTVASTIWIAQRAGLQVFATGGIGGVHRGSGRDVSADLPELARTPITVVCSGAKIVLDLHATREWLETFGITIAGYQCDELPAFYSRASGLPVDTRVNSPEDVVQLVKAQRRLGTLSSLLVTVPVPRAAEVPATIMERVLEEAMDQARLGIVSGRDLTPFLLARMSEKSEGATLRANIALLENNVQVATEIASALADSTADTF
jgi:pseudouridine-5'-phosphate glycosidase